MKIILLLVVLTFWQSSCFQQNNSPQNTTVSNSPPTANDESGVATNAKENSETESENAEKKYPGVTIDQKFPLLADHDFREEERKGKTYFVEANDFSIAVRNFAPQTIGKNGETLFKFKTLTPNDYRSNLIGISHLLGEKSKEIYVVGNGPGAVCCTNYWIVDVTNGKPRNIFRSEDYGSSFREPMEVFDADGDAVYELVQFDSAFRYFMDDCGSCSPEPRAVFKYNQKTGTYLPAKGIQQDFAKESLTQTEKWLEETSIKLKKENDPGLENDFSRSALAYVVDLFYLGDDRQAWKMFDKYFYDFETKEKIRREIKKRLKQSQYYQALKKLN